jgi:hypothetical protein
VHKSPPDDIADVSLNMCIHILCNEFQCGSLGSSEMYSLTSDAIHQETPQVEFQKLRCQGSAKVYIPRGFALYIPESECLLGGGGGNVDFPRGFQKLISQGGLQMLITQLAIWCWGLYES